MPLSHGWCAFAWWNKVLEVQAESKTLTLIDWGLADDFSGGLARAGQLYLDADGNPPKKGKDEALEGVGQVG